MINCEQKNYIHMKMILHLKKFQNNHPQFNSIGIMEKWIPKQIEGLLIKNIYR